MRVHNDSILDLLPDGVTKRSVVVGGGRDANGRVIQSISYTNPNTHITVHLAAIKNGRDFDGDGEIDSEAVIKRLDVGDILNSVLYLLSWYKINFKIPALLRL